MARTLLARGGHLVVVALMSAIVLAGFWPFYSGVLRGGTGSHWLIYVHAAVFSGWMVLLAVQVWLVFRRRVRTHQQLGRFGIVYGVILLSLGVAVTIVATVQSVVTGRSTLDEAAGFLVLPTGDLLLFAGFFGAGIYFRRRRELHKRMMVLASVALLFPAAARLAGDVSMIAVLMIWLLPIAVIMAHEAITMRKVDRVYVVGTAILFAAFARIAFMNSEVWLVIGRRLLHPFVQA